jgi:ABC-2 type transport system permease protein
VNDGAVLQLSSRLVRRGALILAAAGAAYVALEVASYEQSYPTAAARARLATFQDNPSVRMLQGLARNVDTTGGFVAWDGGWFLETVAAIWVLLAVLRLTRGDEETDRSALLLMVPLRAPRVLSLQLVTVWVAGAAFSAACCAVLLVFGVPFGGAALFGLGLGGFVATYAGLATVTGQLFDVRRRAVGAASGLLALTYLLRMVGNSSDAWSWLRWLTPYGWMDNLQAYGNPSWVALTLLLVAPLGLAALCAALRSARDTGGAILPSRESRAANTRLLASPVAFAWRCSRGVLLAWACGLALYAALIGSLLPSLVSYLADDPALRKSLETYGIDVHDITKGMVSFMSTLFGLAFALYACWRIGAARSEEDSGRADLLLVRPLARRRWLGGHLVLAAGSVLLLAVTTGLGLWAGGAVASADLSVGEAVGATLNTVPPALLLAAFAVVVFGTRPRLTVALSASVAGAAYLLPTLGSALSLPGWVLDASPFQHLAKVPMDAYAVTSGALMLLLAAALTVGGVTAFSRRDLTGA